jgi:uncharacterized alpha/beta hydrolase family protein
MNEKYIVLSAIIIILLTAIASSFFFSTANGQQQHLPVLLIHGYLNDASVWNEWIVNLRAAGIYAEAVTFNGNDKCGSAADHAEQLRNKVEEFKTRTHSDHINIVAHSKGGLDARVYLANNPSIDDVANLIMIGTPNAGSPRAENRDPVEIMVANNICSPYNDEAINDLRVGAPATMVENNLHTQYHTIAGDWQALSDFCMPTSFISCTPVDNDCIDTLAMVNYLIEGSIEIDGPDDGMVPLESVESGEFNPLGYTDNCHTNLFGDEEFNLTMSILEQ